MPIAGHASQSETLEMGRSSPNAVICQGCGDAYQHVTSNHFLACGLRLSSDNFSVLAWQDMDRTGYEGVS